MEWKTVKIGEVCDRVCSGGTPNSRNNMYYDGGIPWLNTKEINFGRIYSTERTISQEGLDNSSAKWIDENSVIVAMYGATAGKVAVSKIRLTTNQACCNLHIDEKKADYNYVYYYLLNNFSILASLANGGAQQNLNAQIIKDFLIPLPPLETQRRIAAILSSLDDKIENNNRINRNLEAQAQALFKSWFVDFELWGGTMPEDWKFGSISAFPHILETGRRPKGGAVESGVPSIGAEHIKGMGTYDYSKTKYIAEEYARSMKTGKIKGYELLIYKDGGKPGYFIPNFTIYGEGYPFDECYINEHVLKLDFPNKAYNIFCYFYFQEPEIMTYLNAQGGKAAIPGINKSDIENISILSPENEAVKQFGDIVMPYFTTILRNLKENQRLAALRDTLLPKLMKGEIAL